MSIFYLVRHAAHGLGDRILVGRSNGVSLSREGRRQALALGAAWRAPLDLVQASPRRRARETAAAIAERHRRPLEIVDALDEVDFGAWTGRSFDDLQEDAGWRDWNRRRSAARAPGGESMEEVRARLVAHLTSLAIAKPDAHIALVTHAEIIRTAILHTLGRSLNDFAAFDAPLASVSIFDWGADGGRWRGTDDWVAS